MTSFHKRKKKALKKFLTITLYITIFHSLRPVLKIETILYCGVNTEGCLSELCLGEKGPGFFSPVFFESGELVVPYEAGKNLRFHSNLQRECLSLCTIHILTEEVCKSQGPSARCADKLPASSSCPASPREWGRCQQFMPAWRAS